MVTVDPTGVVIGCQVKLALPLTPPRLLMLQLVSLILLNLIGNVSDLNAIRSR